MKMHHCILPRRPLFSSLVGAALLVSFACASAQDTPPAEAATAILPASNPAADRDRIASERARLTATATNDSIACYQKFFVNNCLDEIRIRQQQAMAELRRQEIVLERAERQAKAAEQLKDIEEKSSPERRQQDAEKRAAAMKDYDERMAREARDTRDRAALQANEQANREASAKRTADNQQKAAERVQKQAEAAESEKQYRERIEKAEERRARKERERFNRTKPPSKPLPVPQ